MVKGFVFWRGMNRVRGGGFGFDWVGGTGIGWDRGVNVEGGEEWGWGVMGREGRDRG